MGRGRGGDGGYFEWEGVRSVCVCVYLGSQAFGTDYSGGIVRWDGICWIMRGKE